MQSIDLDAWCVSKARKNYVVKKAAQLTHASNIPNGLAFVIQKKGKRSDSKGTQMPSHDARNRAYADLLQVNLSLDFFADFEVSYRRLNRRRS